MAILRTVWRLGDTIGNPEHSPFRVILLAIPSLGYPANHACNKGYAWPSRTLLKRLELYYLPSRGLAIPRAMPVIRYTLGHPANHACNLGYAWPSCESFGDLGIRLATPDTPPVELYYLPSPALAILRTMPVTRNTLGHHEHFSSI